MDLSSAKTVEVSNIESGTIMIPTEGVGKSGIFTTANTEAARSWTSVRVNWPYPGKELILIIETPHTLEQQAFAIILQDAIREGSSVRYMQIIDGNEVDMTDKGCHPELMCDSNYQVILKVLGPSQQTYALYFNYEIISK